METQSKTRKLSELRAKTDRQLVTLIEHKLAAGRRSEVIDLLPLINPTDRRRLECKVQAVYAA